MSDTTEPAPLTEREMNQFVTLAALPTLERALERLRWLEAENAALKAERDEARREVCNARSNPWIPQHHLTVAIERGWDCFAPHTNPTHVSVQDGGGP